MNKKKLEREKKKEKKKMQKKNIRHNLGRCHGNHHLFAYGINYYNFNFIFMMIICCFIISKAVSIYIHIMIEIINYIEVNNDNKNCAFIIWESIIKWTLWRNLNIYIFASKFSSQQYFIVLLELIMQYKIIIEVFFLISFKRLFFWTSCAMIGFFYAHANKWHFSFLLLKRFEDKKKELV